MGAYFSGIIILLAHCQYYPKDKSARRDHKLAKDGIKLLLELVHAKHDDHFVQVMSVLNDLEFIVDKAIDVYQGDEVVPQPPVVAPEGYSISDDFFNFDSMSDLVSEYLRPLSDTNHWLNMEF